MNRLILTFCILLCSFGQVFSHSVQVQWCVSCEGDLRIWLEHWHGTEDPNTTTMTISVTIDGVTTTITSVPGGGVIDVIPENLTGCTTPLTYEIGCPGEENSYNDWVYYDFTGLPVNVPLSFTIISGNTVFTEDCGGMYPLTVDFTIPFISFDDQDICPGELTADVIMDDAATWTNDNPSIGLAASGTGTIPSFAPTPSSTTDITTATITYENNCSEGSFDLNIFPSLSFTAVSTDYNGYNISCNGANDGGIDLTVSGGGTSGVYIYEWSDGTTSEDLDGLSPGFYSVLVTDENDCSSLSADIEITEPPILLISEIHSNYTGYGVSCNGASDGFINITVIGGTGEYTYEWSNGATTQDIFDLSPGIYDVIVTDSNGCIIDISAEITEPPLLEISEVHSDYTGWGISCNGASDGFIDITVVGGTGVYTYDWSNGSIDQDLDNLGPGTYTVTVTDENGCFVDVTVDITEPPVLEISETHSDYLGYGVSCNGASDGFIDITVLGGTGVYTYDWSNGAASEDLLNISAGTYMVTATDENGCFVDVTVDITEPDPLEISEVHSDYTGWGVSCNGSGDGFIDITVVGGVGSYTYSPWSNGATNVDLFNIGAGTYSISVTDENGCVSDITVDITEPPILEISEIHSDYTGWGVSCNGASDGFIDITVLGGTGIYTYAWSNGSIDEDIDNLFPDTYTVIATDENGCSIDITVDITEPPILEISEIHSDYTGYGVSCNGSSDGFIDITVLGGTGVYSYDWSNGATSEDLSNIGADTYTVIVTDDNGCSIDITVDITEPDILEILEVHSDYTGYGVSCYGSSDGFINITVVGGAGVYTYDPWSNGATTEDLSNLGVGIYSILVTDENGCIADITVDITEPPILEISEIHSDYAGWGVSCYGSSDGFIDITVTGGAGFYTYNWSTTSSMEDLSNLGPGFYSVLVTDENGCVISLEDIEITEPTPLQMSYSFYDSECGADNGNINTVVYGGQPPYTYLWSTGEMTPDIELLEPGYYSLVITDVNGCSIDFDQDISNIETPPLLIADNIYDCSLTTYLSAFTNDYNSGPWELIAPDTDVVFGDPFSLTTTVTVPDYGTYAFQYSACNTYNTVSVTFSCTLVIPNVLTINGDGNNELFRIKNLNPEIYAQSIFSVYNRWGKVVYFNPSYGLDVNSEWWDGKITYENKPFSMFTSERYYDNQTGYVNDGVYYYTLEVYYKSNQFKDEYTGYIHITRGDF